MPTHLLLAEASIVPGRGRAEPAAHPQPLHSGGRGVGVQCHCTPTLLTPTEGAAPGAQLAQLNLAPGNDGGFTPVALQVEGASLRKGEEMDALFALHW